METLRTARQPAGVADRQRLDELVTPFEVTD
jgi:hypothetical protein